MLRPARVMTCAFSFLAAIPAGAQTIDLRPPIPLREVTTELFKSDGTEPPSFKGASLTGLDLSDLDFKKARLDGADLLGADLSRANLKETSLTGARLDRAIITSTDFSALISRAAALSGQQCSHPSRCDERSPALHGATLHGTIINGWLDRADFRAADLEGAILGNRSKRTKFNSPPARASSPRTSRTPFFAAPCCRKQTCATPSSWAQTFAARFARHGLTQAIFDGADLRVLT